MATVVAQQPRRLTVEIGTIEVRLEPPPAAASVPAATGLATARPIGFDEYATTRSYGR
jgi:hypothetical protein